MSFFSFGKKNKKQTPSSEEKQKPVKPQVTPPPFPVMPPPEESPAPLFRKKNKKEDMRDFFKIDIYDIFKYKPLPEEDTVVGKDAAGRYNFKLKELELDTFYKVKINKLSAKQYSLTFTSNVNEIRESLIEFIDFCLQLYGSDFMNKGHVSDDDYRDLAMGVFSRMWYGILEVNNLDFRMSLTIHTIRPKEV